MFRAIFPSLFEGLEKAIESSPLLQSILPTPRPASSKAFQLCLIERVMRSEPEAHRTFRVYANITVYREPGLAVAWRRLTDNQGYWVVYIQEYTSDNLPHPDFRPDQTGQWREGRLPLLTDVIGG